MKLLITSIKNGIVIDHIPTEHTMLIMNLLNLESSPHIVIIATNLVSNKLHKKGIIKIANRKFTQQEIDSIALLVHGATLNIIENHKVVEKITIVLPHSIENIAICPNTNCISNFNIASKFIKLSNNTIKCYYCEKQYTCTQIFPKK